MNPNRTKFEMTTRLLALLLLVAAIPMVAAPAGAQNVGDPAPDFTFSTSNGGSITLSNYRGRTVFLFIFGNRCPFCLQVGNRTETEVNQVFSPTGKFVAIGLDTWSNSTPLTVDAFKAQTGITYPLLLNAASIEQSYNTTYDRAIVVDKDGIIRFKGGSVVANTLNSAVSVIEDLIAAGSTASEGEDDPQSFSLAQNFPNPFKGSTSIRYTIAADAEVDLSIYDMLGKRVQVLERSRMSAGEYTATWDGKSESGVKVAPGLYLISLRSNGSVRTRSMIVVP